jgi:hypothetical protein
VKGSFYEELESVFDKFFDSRHYQIFREVVGLERGPLNLVSTTEELLDRKVVAPA